MTAQPLPALTSGDASAWDQALYASLIERNRRPGSEGDGPRFAGIMARTIPESWASIGSPVARSAAASSASRTTRSSAFRTYTLLAWLCKENEPRITAGAPVTAAPTASPRSATRFADPAERRPTRLTPAAYRHGLALALPETVIARGGCRTRVSNLHHPDRGPR